MHIPRPGVLWGLGGEEPPVAWVQPVGQQEVNLLDDVLQHYTEGTEQYLAHK